MKFVLRLSAVVAVPLLALSMEAGRVGAQALSAADREAIYQNVVDTYDDPSTAAPQDAAGTKQTFSDCTLEHLTYNSTNGQTVPALLFVPLAATANKPVPCVILLHGLGGNKEEMSGAARALASLGYASLAIDEYDQGERSVQNAGTPDQAHMMSLIQTGIPQTVVDVRRGVDYLSTRKEIDSSRIGLLGVSLGAIIGSISAGVEPRIKATVLISGGGNWGVILNAIDSVGLLTNGQKTTTLSPSDQVMASVGLAGEDPLTFAPHIAPRALLMESGRLDKIIPPDSAEQLYDAASAPKNSDVHIDWYAHSGHVPDPSLTAPVIQKWLADHL